MSNEKGAREQLKDLLGVVGYGKGEAAQLVQAVLNPSEEAQKKAAELKQKSDELRKQQAGK